MHILYSITFTKELDSQLCAAKAVPFQEKTVKNATMQDIALLFHLITFLSRVKESPIFL